MAAAVASPRPPSDRSGASGRTPHRPAPPATAVRRLGALGNTEDKKQTARNNAVSARMLELGESIVSIHDSTMISVRAKMAQLAARLKESREAAVECEEAFLWSTPCDWDFAHLIGQFGFTLTVPEIAALTTLGDYSAPPTRLALQELSSTVLAKRGVNNKRGEIRPTDKHAEGRPIAESAITLYEFLHADVLGHAREELSRTDAGIARLLKSIQHHKECEEDAVKVTNTTDAERHRRGLIDDYIELLELLNSRLSQLALSGGDTQSFRGKAQEAIDAAREHFTGFDGQSRRLQDAATADIAKSNDVRKAEEKTHKDACAAHRLYVKTSREKLDANSVEQEDTFAEILRLVDHMKTLSEQRLADLDAAAQEKQREEHRIANYNEFTQVAADHLRHLEAIKDQADNYCMASQGLMEYLGQMEKKIADKDVESELAALTLDEAKRYLQHYRRYVLAAGGLVTKKELRVETLSRQRRLAQLQKDMSLQTLDPDAQRHAQAQLEIDEKVDGVVHDVAVLRGEMDACATNWEVAEDILVRQAVDFDHPHAERGEAAADAKQQYVSRALEFVSAEETAAERQQDQLRKVRAVSENEKHQRRSTRRGGRTDAGGAAVDSEGEALSPSPERADQAKEAADVDAATDTPTVAAADATAAAPDDKTDDGTDPIEEGAPQSLAVAEGTADEGADGTPTTAVQPDAETGNSNTPRTSSSPGADDADASPVSANGAAEADDAPVVDVD